MDWTIGIAYMSSPKTISRCLIRSSSSVPLIRKFGVDLQSTLGKLFQRNMRAFEEFKSK